MIDTNPMLRKVGRSTLLRSNVLTAYGIIRNMTMLIACMLGGAWYASEHLIVLLNGQEAMFFGLLCLPVLLVWYTYSFPLHAWLTAPLYSLLQGGVLWLVSSCYNARFQGLPLQAFVAASSSMLVVLLLYTAGVLRPTRQLDNIMMTGTLTLFLLLVAYIVGIGFGVLPGIVELFEGSGWGSICFNITIVFLTSAHLVYDFAMIDMMVSEGVSDTWGWYAAFCLMVTMIRLYLNMLSLLAKLHRRRRR